MRPYHRPLIVVFSSFALATLLSYAAVELTEPEPKQPEEVVGMCVGVQHPSIYYPVESETKKIADPKNTETTLPERKNQSRHSGGILFCGVGKMTRPSTPSSEEIKNIEAFNKACNEAFGGDPRKLVALANFYLMGIGTEKNEAEATRIYAIGAEKGDAECQARFKAAMEKAAAASR